MPVYPITPDPRGMWGTPDGQWNPPTGQASNPISGIGRDSIARLMMQRGLTGYDGTTGTYPASSYRQDDPGALVGGATMQQPTSPAGAGTIAQPTAGVTTGNNSIIDQPTVGMAPGTTTKAADYAAPATPAAAAPVASGWGDPDAMSRMQFQATTAMGGG